MRIKPDCTQRVDSICSGIKDRTTINVYTLARTVHVIWPLINVMNIEAGKMGCFVCIHFISPVEGLCVSVCIYLVQQRVVTYWPVSNHAHVWPEAVVV